MKTLPCPAGKLNVPVYTPSPSLSTNRGTSGDTFSAQVEPIQLPHVHQQFKKEPLITSVSGVTGNGSLLLAFNVPSKNVACISTVTSFARGPTGRMTGASGSRTISSPQK